MSRRRVTLRVLGLLWIAAALPVASAPPLDCTRTIAVGDLHGGYAAFLTILGEAGVLDVETLDWVDERTCLIQLGDVVDRGPDSRRILDLLIALESRTPQRVTSLLGNHEMMAIVGDLRYVDPGEIAAFASDETAAERDRGFEWYAGRESVAKLNRAAQEAAFAVSFPPGWFARRRAFSGEGRYGARLLGLPVAVIRDGTLFVHGGLSPDEARSGVEALNARTQRVMRDFLQQRNVLVAAGVFGGPASLVESIDRVNAWLQDRRPGRNARSLEAAARAYVTAAVELCDERGTLWNRDLALADERVHAAALGAVLAATGAQRIVVAHTTTADGRIGVRSGGRVFVIDTGAGPAYGGRPAALEIEADGRVSAIYPGRRELLVDPLATDAGLEAFLLDAEVVGSREIGSGISRPHKVELRLGRRVRSAAFKTIDEHVTGLTRFRSSGAELGFSDSYRYERAAYLLDRELGLGMVPVTVLRTIDGVEGALTDWVADAINEKARAERRALPSDPRRLLHQQAVMRVFDALVLNTDRNLANQLITLDDWKLHAIDHSRTFRLSRDLPDWFVDQPASLPRSLLAALERLNEPRLRVRMRGVLSRAQIRALLARRAAILEKVAADLERYGDAMVFHDPGPVHAP